METKNKSGLAGFLDSYTANNIETNSTILNFHSSELISLLEKLQIDAKTNYQFSNEINDHIKKAHDSLTKKDNTLDQFLNSGLGFDEFMLEFKKINNPKSETSQLLKKIIYHYLNISKQTPSGTMEEIAKKMASKF